MWAGSKDAQSSFSLHFWYKTSATLDMYFQGSDRTPDIVNVEKPVGCYSMANAHTTVETSYRI